MVTAAPGTAPLPAAPPQATSAPTPAPPTQIVAPAPQAPRPVQRPFTIRSTSAGPGPLKAMIYGGYGAGKTTFAGTAVDVPAMGDVLYIDSEAGHRSLADKEVDRIPVTNFFEVNQVKEYLIRHCQLRDSGNIEGLRTLEAMVREGEITTPKQYRTVVIDSLSELYKLLLYELVGVKVGATALDATMDNLDGAGWGQAGSRIELLIRTFRDLPLNVIFVASSMEKEDEMKRRIYYPNFSGKLAKNVQGFLDVVGFLFVQHDEKQVPTRILSLVPGPNYDAKNRFTGSSVSFLANPKMADLYALHTGAK